MHSSVPKAAVIGGTIIWMWTSVKILGLKKKKYKFFSSVNALATAGPQGGTL